MTNVLFPEANALLVGIGQLKGSEGWLVSGANGLIEGDSHVELAIATESKKVKSKNI